MLFKELPKIKELHKLMYNNIINQLQNKPNNDIIYIESELLHDALNEALILLRSIAIQNQPYYTNWIIMTSHNNLSQYPYNHELWKDFLNINKLIKLVYLIAVLNHYYINDNPDNDHKNYVTNSNNNQFTKYPYFANHFKEILKNVILDNFKSNPLLLNFIINKSISDNSNKNLHNNIYVINVKECLVYKKLIEKISNNPIIMYGTFLSTMPEILKFKTLHYNIISLRYILNNKNNILIYQYNSHTITNDHIEKEIKMDDNEHKKLTIEKSHKDTEQNEAKEENLECGCISNLLLFISKFRSKFNNNNIDVENSSFYNNSMLVNFKNPNLIHPLDYYMHEDTSTNEYLNIDEQEDSSSIDSNSDTSSSASKDSYTKNNTRHDLISVMTQ